MRSCDDYIKCKISLVLLCCNSKLEFKETKVLSLTYPQYSLCVYKSDITEWFPRWPENLKQAVKYEVYLCRKSVYERIDDFHRYIFVLSVASVKEIVIALFFVGDFGWVSHLAEAEALHSLCF